MRALITALALIGMLAASVARAGDFGNDMAAIDAAARHGDLAALENVEGRLARIAQDEPGARSLRRQLTRLEPNEENAGG